MEKKKIIIIGAGPGGLTAGMILAHGGFDVEIFERMDTVGGRNRQIQVGDYKFDLGPTFFMMKFLVEKIFESTGRKLEDYIELKEIEPMYYLNFKNRTIPIKRNLDDMKEVLKNELNENPKGTEKFKKIEKKRYDLLFPCLEKDYSSFGKLFNKNLLRALPYLGIDQSLYKNLGHYFKNDLSKLCFTFQAKYIGMSPWKCPRAFTIIPHIEHAFGIYHVIGGLNKVSYAMEKVIQELGGKIHLNSIVKNIIIENKKCIGVELLDGSKHLADEIIINADFAYAMSNIIPDKILKKYSKENLKKKKYSCSTFMLYLGIDKEVDIPHHNVYFADDYRQNVDDIFENKKLSSENSFYIHNPSKIDKTLAPIGKSSIYVLVPITNNFAGIDWEKEKINFRNKIIDSIKKKVKGLENIENNIEVEKIITPDDWENDYCVYNGATFNLSHNALQMLYFRPRNKFEELKNCYLVGGGTHPGSGLPTIYQSAKISANMIIDKYK